jgi:hypothetical protein
MSSAQAALPAWMEMMRPEASTMAKTLAAPMEAVRRMMGMCVESSCNLDLILVSEALVLAL